jgi:hypothetical protein
MGSSTQLILLAAVIHVTGLILAVVLLVPILRGEDARAPRRPDEGDDGGGGNHRTAPAAPTKPSGGGIPLPDARPSRRRLRGPGRGTPPRPWRERRPAREPRREPIRSGPS